MITDPTLPLLRLPESLPAPVVATAAMAALAGLDLFGALAAKEWTLGHGDAWGFAGVLSFVILFWLYASSLQYAELAVVTMGWIVLLQVGIVAMDWLRFGVELPGPKVVAIRVILVAQGYLVLGPST